MLKHFLLKSYFLFWHLYLRECVLHQGCSLVGNISRLFCMNPTHTLLHFQRHPAESPYSVTPESLHCSELLFFIHILFFSSLRFFNSRPHLHDRCLGLWVSSFALSLSLLVFWNMRAVLIPLSSTLHGPPTWAALPQLDSMKPLSLSLLFIYTAYTHTVHPPQGWELN